VEVGGWDSKFYRQNPPPEFLEEWAEKEARFNLMLAGSLPMVEMHDPVIKSKDGEVSLEIELENTGFLPTALKQAQLVKIVRPDRLELEFPAGMLPRRAEGRGRFRGMYRGRPESQQPEQTGKPKIEIIAPEKNQPYAEIGRIPGNSKVKVIFKLRLNDIESTKCTIRYSSTRGGVLSKDIVIGK
jgi:hypothetical protein